jgi:hypothetical protein
VPGGRSAYRPRIVCVEIAGLVFFMFIACSCVSFFRSNFGPFLVAGGLADGMPGVHGQSACSVLVADGPRCLHGRSIIEGAVLEVHGRFSDSSPQLVDGPSCHRRRSAVPSRTVRPKVAESPPGDLQDN